jgi:hypothetical protein
MINRIKEWDIKNLKINDRQVISLALILSVMALVMAIPSSSNCASANTCTVASTGTFTGNLGIKSNTAYQLTQQHSLAVDQVANWEAVGGNHTGSVIMKDNSGDFNLNGGLVLGTSATSTNGTIRWNGSAVQVYNSGWQGIAATPTDDIGQVTADSGSFTASSQQDNINAFGGTGVTTSITSDTLTINATNDIGTVAGDSGSFSAATSSDTVNIVGTGGISTSVTGDTLTISSSSGGTPITAYFGLSSDQTTSSQNGVPFNVEKYDSDNCFTLNYSSVGSDISYTCADTRVFKVGVRYHFYKNSSFSWNQYVGVNLGNYPSAYQMELYGNSYTAVNGGHDTGYVENYICLEQNNDLEFVFGSMPNSVSMRGSSQLQRNNVQLSEDPGLTVLAQSNGCTNGVID